jgi:hypothetical protein
LNKPNWSEKEDKELLKAYLAKAPSMSDKRFSKTYKSDRSPEAIRIRIGVLIQKMDEHYLTTSPYPTYDTPLVMEGDALILPDIEMPFHHAEFLNTVLDLAQAWGIRQCIMAGDLLHFDSLSGWEPNWTNEDKGGLSAEAEKALVDFAMGMSSKKQGELMELIGNIGIKDEQNGVSTELNVARKELQTIDKLFDRVDFVIGNHEGRLLRALQTTLNPSELLRLLDIKNPKWRIAPFYYSKLETERGTYRIEHPKNSGKFSASRLASKYLAHILMAHSHQLNFTYDPSGTFYAIEMGCGVDETRLAYVGQRSNASPTHMLGAVIVRKGIPWLLHNGVDWDALKSVI